MADPRPNIFTVCRAGPKCTRKYFEDWQKRTAELGPENQGTGDLCADLDEVAGKLGVVVTAVPSNCLELCPLPWDRSMLIDPNGKGHDVYFEDLPDLVRNWDKT